MIIKIAILVALVIFIFYRCTKDFNFDLVDITSWEYSTRTKYYVVEFTWIGSSRLTGFLISDEPPSVGERYVIAGYDISKGMWHIVKKKCL